MDASQVAQIHNFSWAVISDLSEYLNTRVFRYSSTVFEHTRTHSKFLTISSFFSSVLKYFSSILGFEERFEQFRVDRGIVV